MRSGCPVAAPVAKVGCALAYITRVRRIGPNPNLAVFDHHVGSY